MKKLICIIAAVILLAFLVACNDNDSEEKNDPTTLVHDPITLTQLLGDDYTVEILIDDADDDEFPPMLISFFGLSQEDVCSILEATPVHEGDDKMGIFIFCKDMSAAKNVEEDMESFAETYEILVNDFSRFTIERSGDLVFFGCEDVWEKVQEE